MQDCRMGDRPSLALRFLSPGISQIFLHHFSVTQEIQPTSVIAEQCGFSGAGGCSILSEQQLSMSTAMLQQVLPQHSSYKHPWQQAHTQLRAQEKSPACQVKQKQRVVVRTAAADSTASPSATLDEQELVANMLQRIEGTGQAIWPWLLTIWSSEVVSPFADKIRR